MRKSLIDGPFSGHIAAPGTGQFSFFLATSDLADRHHGGSDRHGWDQGGPEGDVRYRLGRTPGWAGGDFARDVDWLQQIDWTAAEYGPFLLDMPLAVRLCLDQTRPLGYHSGADISYSQLNPYLMAGWVGLLITGLNMLPVSQLDGGHVIYTLFGKRSYWIARGFMLLAVVYIVYARAGWWSMMVLLILLMGIDHPPTRDDTVRLGWFRTSLGLLSLLIPVFCFPLHVLKNGRAVGLSALFALRCLETAARRDILTDASDACCRRLRGGSRLHRGSV
jgi:hypothetical protein